MTAVDHDVGENGQVVYSVVEGDELFTMRADTGEVVLNGDLSLEHQNKEYELILQAQDQGTYPNQENS